MADVLSFEEATKTQQKVLSFEDVTPKKESLQLEEGKPKIISFEDAISSEPVPKESNQVDINYLNEHPLFEKTNQFNLTQIPNFESIEGAAAFYGLPVDKIRPAIEQQDLVVPMTEVEANIDYSKKFVPNLELDPKYIRDGSINPFDDYKADFSISKKAFDQIWTGELGIDEVNLPANTPGRNFILGATDVLDGALRGLETLTYGGMAAVSDTITNLTGDKQKGKEMMDVLVTAFEGTLPLQINTIGTTAGFTKGQIKKYNQQGKQIIDDYVETTFKDSPKKESIKKDLQKKFEEGNLKAENVLDRTKKIVEQEANKPNSKISTLENSYDFSKFDKVDPDFKNKKPIKNLWQFSDNAILRNVDKFVLSPFRSRSRRTPKVQRSYENYQANVRALNNRAVLLSNKISSTIDDLVKKTPKDFKQKAKTKFLDDVQNYLSGKTKITTLPKSLRQTAAKTRELTDNLTQHLIKSGNLSDDLVKTLESNVGKYLRRSYEVFEKRGYKPQPKIIEEAKAYIKKEDPKLSDLEVEGLINNILRTDREKGALGIFETVPKQDRKLFIKRKDLAEPIRKLLGEVKDPTINIEKTISRMGNWLSSDKYFNSVKKDGMGTYLFEKPTGRYSEKINLGNYNALDGLYTSPGYANVLKNLDTGSMGSSIGSDLMRLFLKAKGTTQYLKTVYNHVTQIRNIQGMGIMLGFNGINPFTKTGWNAVQTVFNDIFKKGSFTSVDEAFKAKYQEYLELGLVRSSVKANEIKMMMKEGQGLQKMEDFLARLTDRAMKVKQFAKKTNTVIEDIYMGVDDIGKIIAYETELKTLRKAFPNKDINLLKRQASDIVTNTMPTYDKVPNAIKLLRRAPIGNFVSFPAEIIRNTYNSLARAAYEIKTPGLQARGSKRLAGNLVFGLLGAKGLETALRLGQDISEDTLKGIRRFVAPWSKNSNLFVLDKDDKGTVSVIDGSYTDAYDIIKRPINTVLNAVAEGKDAEKELLAITGDATTQAIRELLEPFISESILTKALLDIQRNIDSSTGARIYNPQSSEGEIAKAKFLHVIESYYPGGLEQGAKLIKAVTGEKGSYGQEYDLKTELVANLLGLRITTIDTKESLDFKTSDYRKDIGDSEYLFRQVANNQSPKSIDDYVNAYIDSEKARYRNFSELYMDIQAAIELGTNVGDIDNILKEKGFSKEDRDYVLSGYYKPYFPSDETLTRIYDSGNPYPEIELSMVYNKLTDIPLNDYTAFNNNLKGDK